MSPFVLYRTVVATDPNTNFTEVLDMAGSISASRNEVHILVKQTVGAPTRIKLEFYTQLPAASAPAGLAGTWLLVEKSTFISPLELNRFSGLIAGTYKLKAILEAAGTFEIYVSTNVNNLGTT